MTEGANRVLIKSVKVGKVSSQLFTAVPFFSSLKSPPDMAYCYRPTFTRTAFVIEKLPTVTTGFGHEGTTLQYTLSYYTLHRCFRAFTDTRFTYCILYKNIAISCSVLTSLYKVFTSSHSLIISIICVLPCFDML